MRDLASRECVPCRGGVPPMSADEIKTYLPQLRGWKVFRNHHLKKHYEFKNFLEAQRFVARVSRLAEREGHHPDICFGWGYAELKIWTHKIDGLSESDFILAAKIDRL
ncbi:MAG: 4a-hydroxytetrahydrobiopterin dehydratase [Acidobacteria bacterium]|nr:4a-hydroxytetrahydrobiopterin dehydratase [Acidobacteriota bacterium]